MPNDSVARAFHLRTEHKKFLNVSDNIEDPRISGDAEIVSHSTIFRIQMQAQFKPKLIVSKETKKREKINKKEIENNVGRKLENNEVKRFKKARVQGNYHEIVLDAKIKKKHDKYA